MRNHTFQRATTILTLAALLFGLSFSVSALPGDAPVQTAYLQ